MTQVGDVLELEEKLAAALVQLPEFASFLVLVDKLPRDVVEDVLAQRVSMSLGTLETKEARRACVATIVTRHVLSSAFMVRTLYTTAVASGQPLSEQIYVSDKTGMGKVHTVDE